MSKKRWGEKSGFQCLYARVHASLFVQLVDVLVGSVVFDYRIETLKHYTPNHYKNKIVELIRKKLEVHSLTGRFMKRKPNCFSVGPFKIKSEPSI